MRILAVRQSFHFAQLLMLLTLFLFTSVGQGFVLVDPDYHLVNPTDTAVNIASGGCQTNGISNDELKGAVQTAIDQYWNTVAESRLKLRVGDEVSRTLAVGNALAGEILIGCSPLGSGGASGVTYPTTAKGSAIIILNGTTLVPGGYTSEGLLGVIAHEMGHAIGLGHSDDNASVMTYRSNSWSPSPTYLAQDDKDGVTFLYPNEGKLMGLLGGCSSLAANDRSRLNAEPRWSAIANEAIFFAAVAGLTALALSASKRKNRS